MAEPNTTLTEIKNLTQLYKDGDLKAADKPETKAFARFNDIVSLWKGDITTLQIDAIVNAAKESLRGGGGIDGVIHEAAGLELDKECETLGGCKTGGAKITGAYNLPCKKIVHAVGPIYAHYLEEKAKELLQSCYRKSLEVGVQNQCFSIAFPCISIGIFGYPLGKATLAVVELVRQYLETNFEDGPEGLERVIICCYDEEQVRLYKQTLVQYFPPI